MMQILQVFYSIFSGILTALAIPNEILPMGSPILGIISLIPLFMAIFNAKSFRQAGIFTGLQLTVTHLLSSYWLGKFKDFAIFTLGASALVYFIFGLVFGNYLYTAFHYTIKKNPLKQYSLTSISYAPQRIFSFAIIWTIYEWFKSTGFLAYPWGTLVMSAYKWGLISQIVSITGTWGISFLFSLFSAVIAEGLLLLPNVTKYHSKTPIKMYAQSACVCMVLLLASTIFGTAEHFLYKYPDKTMNVTLIQNNAAPWISRHEDILLSSMDLTEQALKDNASKNIQTDLIVWNESTLGYQFPRALTKYQTYPKSKPFLPFLKEIKTPLVTGAPVKVSPDSFDLSNSAIYFDAEGNFIDSYGKIHLVPFAEVIPYADKPFVQKFMQKVAGFSNGWTPGKYYKLFSLPIHDGTSVNFTTPICFEDAFADLCRDLYLFGSEVFINITNDSWSETSASEYQHFVIASYRTMELRTPMVRSCTSGYTVVIDSLGRVVSDLPVFEKHYLNAQVPIYKRTMTTYALLGDWLVYIAFALILVYLVMIYLQQKKENTTTSLSIQHMEKIDIEDDINE